MIRQFFSTFVAVIFVVGSSVSFADAPPLTKYDEYFGNYQFADGRVLSGGPLIEGDQHLVFMDLDQLDTVGSFVHAEGDEFKSQMPPGECLAPCNVPHWRCNRSVEPRLECRTGGGHLRTWQSARSVPYPPCCKSCGYALLGPLTLP